LTSGPRCSIVIPVHNKAGLTRRCLDAIIAEPPKTSFELVVVDDASTDGTPDLLAGYGDAVKVIRQEPNAGFAAASNAGAKAARGELLVFLNNDTVPLAGWLDALVAHGDREPSAAVVGAKLLFPDDTIQHAGVVICQDGNPRHLYAGFPHDHPAVDKSRRFQAVTAACALVRREAFEQAGGFDTAFLNGLEDVDLCLRLGELGHEVHYCPGSVLYHLESISRGRRSKQIQEGARLFRRRWDGRVRPDDLDYYVADGLLRVGYRDAYPLPVEISPQLGLVNGGGQGADRMLEASSRHLAELLQETVRLTAHIAELELRGAGSDAAQPGTRPKGGGARSNRAGDGAAESVDLEGLLARVQEIEIEIYDLQEGLVTALRRAGEGAHVEDASAFAASEQLGYRKLITDLRRTVGDAVPDGATVVVVSRGDEELLELGSRPAWHFPQAEDGAYAGHYPADASEAIAQLERLRTRGAGFLVLPRTALWWLVHYPELAQHLDRRYTAIVREPDLCLIYDLTAIGDRRGEESG
jgi:GT2 family glycosyltransferase